MAKAINWSKHKQLTLKGDMLRDLPKGGSQNTFYKDNNLWTMRGKYYGSHIHNLPLHYLNWLVDNFDSGSYKQAAIDELYRRYNASK